MDPRQCAEVSIYFGGLADMVEHPSAASAKQRTKLAERLRELADRRLVALPAIDPARDDVAHWVGLSDDRLRSENYADAWNLHRDAT